MSEPKFYWLCIILLDNIILCKDLEENWITYVFLGRDAIKCPFLVLCCVWGRDKDEHVTAGMERERNKNVQEQIAARETETKKKEGEKHACNLLQSRGTDLAIVFALK